jgi:putative Mg2+ transporter-C (MgtC) family protein
MEEMVIILRLVLAVVMGGLVGIEREIHGRAAGLRTHILVSLGAALFMITSILVSDRYASLGSQVDPSRIAAGVVTGIGFLGAGAIIRFGASIRGLTTAASIWAVAAIGLAVGAGFYEAAITGTLLVIVVLFLSRLEERMELKRHGKRLEVQVSPQRKEDVKEEIKNVIETFGGKIKKFTSEEGEAEEVVEFIFDLTLARACQGEALEDISSLQGVEKVRWVKEEKGGKK